MNKKSKPAKPKVPGMEGLYGTGGTSVAQRQDIRDRLRDLLLRDDPINVNYGGGVDAYRPEIERIVQRLPSCRCAQDVCSVIHKELCNSFGPAVVGGPGCYSSMAVELWALQSTNTHGRPR